MPKYVIERDMPAAGKMSAAELRAGARQSCAALAQLAPGIHWLHSYVTNDKVFCVYVAEDEQLIAKHAELSGFPCTTVNSVAAVIDPASAE